MQNLQPVGTVNWSHEAGDPWLVQENINNETDDVYFVNVLFGGDFLVNPEEDGDWLFVGEIENEDDYYYDRTDELAKESDDYFIVDVAGHDGRYLFVEDSE